MRSESVIRLGGALRSLAPLLLVPLTLLASVLAAVPWLRAFPLTVAGGPIYGAAIVSALVPMIVSRLRPRWFWRAIAIDAVGFVLYALLVVLQSPAGFGQLADGLFRGPSQVLTFALPLVAPRSLMIAPVALVWLAGAVAGECFGRRWYTVVPYGAYLVAFGLAYAATQRAGAVDLTRETLLAGAVLATLLALRAVQVWVRQDETAETTQPDGVLPLRGLILGTAVGLVIALVAGFAMHSDVFGKSAAALQRVPPVIDDMPLAPLAFVAALRPTSPTEAGATVFTVRTGYASSGYFQIANLDTYDGSGWSFERTFRPSGGVLPPDPDPQLAAGASVTQTYTIDAGPLTTSPWMPYLFHPERVTGAEVNIDAASGMIVPAGRLAAREAYTVQSQTGDALFPTIDAATANADTATPVLDTTVPAELQPTLNRLIRSFSIETGVPSTPALPFLQALQKDLRTGYGLSNGTPSTSSAPASPTTSRTTKPGSTSRARSGSKTTPRSPARSAAKSLAKSSPAGSASPSGPPAASGGASRDTAGGTGFADVLGSILGAGRSGTPEQFATLVALVARELGVPARVATGFRVRPADSTTATLPPGSYDVTTADAWTWIEIPIDGEGWVVLDASPTRGSTAPKPSQSAAPATSSSPPPSQNAQISAGDSGHALAPKVTVTGHHSAARHGLLVALPIALGVLLILLIALLASRKPLRASRRRRLDDPRDRLVGAWQEGLDVLAEAGLPDLRALTSREVASLAHDRFGPTVSADAAALGRAADAVVYASANPDPTAANQAWDHVRRLRRELRGQLGVGERVAAGLRYRRASAPAESAGPRSWADESQRRREDQHAARRRRSYRGRRRAH